MRPAPHQGKYLNVILTVNAALLSAVVWMQIAGSPLGSSAQAFQAPPVDGGIPNAGSQRQKQIEELQAMRAAVDAMRKTLEGGKTKVIVANADEIRASDKGE